MEERKGQDGADEDGNEDEAEKKKGLL